ncbi:hypothetical protein [Microcoleus sp. MON2_D5]
MPVPKQVIENGAIILHHSQEQARCLFHNKIHLLWNRQDACS